VTCTGLAVKCRLPGVQSAVLSLSSLHVAGPCQPQSWCLPLQNFGVTIHSRLFLTRGAPVTAANKGIPVGNHHQHGWHALEELSAVCGSLKGEHHRTSRVSGLVLSQRVRAGFAATAYLAASACMATLSIFSDALNHACCRWRLRYGLSLHIYRRDAGISSQLHSHCRACKKARQ
jgi:hypothetical protein